MKLNIRRCISVPCAKKSNAKMALHNFKDCKEELLLINGALKNFKQFNAKTKAAKKSTREGNWENKYKIILDMWKKEPKIWSNFQIQQVRCFFKIEIKLV